MLTIEEKELLNRLSKPPKCMHNPAKVIYKEKYIQCGECGFIAKRIFARPPHE
jgi:hypothetical protein